MSSAYTGPFFANLNNSPSNTNANYGASISYPNTINNAVYIVGKNDKSISFSLPLGKNRPCCEHLLVALLSNVDERIRDYEIV